MSPYRVELGAHKLPLTRADGTDHFGGRYCGGDVCVQHPLDIAGWSALLASIPRTYTNKKEPQMGNDDIKIGDRVRVISSASPRELPISSTHYVAEVQRDGRLLRIGGRWWYTSRFVKVAEPKPKPKVKLTKRVMTDLTVECASGDGDKLVIGYDPTGNKANDGPCIDFELEPGNVRLDAAWVGIDIEDIATLDAVISTLRKMRADFVVDSK